ncbi:MAG TPA: DEAD/DEAH box helicase [Rhodanobacteraceae bacterium]|jgi:ATP-dependent RNA helicase DeaD|nr:DEAD/DEAH box helicase [Rhodanobacteraceae bacterium]
MPNEESPATPTFADLGLGTALLATLAEVGYESPSPIQAATIPPFLEGRDVLGQAQTGTGKTAAFALPILARLDLSKTKPQALVLAPTRELAIQVAEAFQRYAGKLPGFHVLPIYGGQSYGPQLGGLKRGVHVVVGTPGRVIDHLERGSLDLSGLTTLVLDEGDEMLRMGFIDDVEAVLKKTPPTRQIALFSATMPAPIRRIAQTYLRAPVEISIKSKTTTATNIRQRYWWVSGLHKLDALTRILEAETFDAMLVFTRTKQATEELAEKLQARGFSAAAINGDIVQAQRERTIQQLKDGKVDILVATDVAARGLDVERISHVLNYDIPHDTEGYVHRIGRTGRAGRSGEAILFVTPREKRLLQAIERATRQPIAEMQLPSVEAVNDKRVSKFKQRIGDTLAAGELGVFQQVIEQYQGEHNVPAIEIAAALAKMVQGNAPLLLKASERNDRARTPREPERREHAGARSDHREGRVRNAPRERDVAAAPAFRRKAESRSFSPAENKPERGPRRHDDDARHVARSEPRDTPAAAERPTRDSKRRDEPESGFETFRIEVGHDHGVKPGNIVGAIANEAGLDSKHIGRVDIRDDHSFVDLPEGMPSDVFKLLKKVWVSGQQLRITRSSDAPGAHPPDRASRDLVPRHGKSGGFASRPAKPAGFAPRSPKPAGFARPKRPKPGKRPR